jgi:hypothetical protein
MANGDEFHIRSIDIVNYGGPLIIVACLEGDESKNIIHYRKDPSPTVHVPNDQS